MKKYIKILGKVRPTVDGDWSKDKLYDILTIVYDKDSKKSYISRKKVPVGINILNKDYWMNISTTRVDNDSIVLLSNPNDIGQINSFTLQEAVDSFDNEDKRIGLFISFYEKPVHELDTYKWNLYQFIGSDINQFNDITKWISIYNRSNKFLGLYLTEGKLNEVKRNPEVGDYAFVGNTLKEAIVYRCNVNGKWTKTKESAVDYIELKLSGNVTVGENGNWFNDGVDTGFKAKGEDGKTPQIVISKDNKLQVSYDGINFTNITENIVYTQYRVSGNKLQYSIDLGKTWNDASGFISANFRWKPTSVAAGKIQISRENEVWEDLSPEFVSNSADEEDLESIIIGDNNRVIREKSVKEYNPAEFSGLGRVILRKNIVQGKNVLTQEMINKPNTVYEIRYDFDLNDATINIPENCTLYFKGGSLSNGILNGNKTIIINKNNNHIFKNINILNKFHLEFPTPKWFGCIGDGISNDTEYFRYALFQVHNVQATLYIDEGVYYITGSLNYYNNQYYDIYLSLIGLYIDRNNLYIANRCSIKLADNISLFKDKEIKGYIKNIKFIGTRNKEISIFNNCTLKGFRFESNIVSNIKNFILDSMILSITKIIKNNFLSVEYFAKAETICIGLVDSDISYNYINGGIENKENYCFGFNDYNGSIIHNNFIDFYRVIYQSTYISEERMGSNPVSLNNNYQVFRHFWMFNNSDLKVRTGGIYSLNDIFNHIGNKFKNFTTINININEQIFEIPIYIYACDEKAIFCMNNAVLQNNIKDSSIIFYLNSKSQYQNFDKVDFKWGYDIPSTFFTFVPDSPKRYYISPNYKESGVDINLYQIVDELPLLNIGWSKTPLGHKVSLNGIIYKAEIIYNKSTKSYAAKWVEQTLTAINKIGNTSNRPTNAKQLDFYYDTDLNKLIFWGNKWIDSDGNPADALKKGTTEQRPIRVQIGFTYKDTDLNKWIIWNGEAWENIDGTALT